VTQERHRASHQAADRPAPARGPSAPVQRAPPRFLLSDWRSKKASTYFLATPLGNEVEDLQNQAYMADSKDLNRASPNSSTRLTNLSAAEHKRLKDDMKKIDEEVQR
jgi:hypothetical protein